MDSTPAAIVAEVQGRCERYSIGKPLGNGTFGTVYEARPQSEATVVSHDSLRSAARWLLKRLLQQPAIKEQRSAKSFCTYAAISY